MIPFLDGQLFGFIILRHLLLTHLWNVFAAGACLLTTEERFDFAVVSDKRDRTTNLFDWTSEVIAIYVYDLVVELKRFDIWYSDTPSRVPLTPYLRFPIPFSNEMSSIKYVFLSHNHFQSNSFRPDNTPSNSRHGETPFRPEPLLAHMIIITPTDDIIFDFRSSSPRHRHLPNNSWKLRTRVTG